MRKPNKARLPYQQDIVKELLKAHRHEEELLKAYRNKKALLKEIAENQEEKNDLDKIQDRELESTSALDIAWNSIKKQSDSHLSPELVLTIDQSFEKIKALIVLYNKRKQQLAKISKECEKDPSNYELTIHRSNLSGYLGRIESDIHELIYHQRCIIARDIARQEDWDPNREDPQNTTLDVYLAKDEPVSYVRQPQEYQRLSRSLAQLTKDKKISKNALIDRFFGLQRYDREHGNWITTLEHTARNIDNPDTKFHNVSLYGLNLRGKDLKTKSFELSDLSRADFQDANLTGASFKNATLYSTNLIGATLDRVNWVGVKLAHTKRTDVDARYLEQRINYSTSHAYTPRASRIQIRHVAKLNYTKHGAEILRQNFCHFEKLITKDYPTEPDLKGYPRHYLQTLVSIVASQNEEVINADLIKSILRDIGKINLGQAQQDNPKIKSKSDLLAYQKTYAKVAVEFLLPHVTNFEELVKLKDIFDAYDDNKSDFAYIRKERDLLQFGYGNTGTWEYITGEIKQQLIASLKKGEYAEGLQSTSQDYQDFYSMMVTTHPYKKILRKI